ncbi:uncharacterized protein PRCAT00005846001 [Priceomyces carsonii]|uniref:uncharacterized protein n=1 Tax=Priceomyces carsonii TaxID=28549 RepID=UPI002ED93E3D|nr:unnamed protein product [Priceomyces carsonii]
MFPKHLRFSIHAHSNSGPKFGISLWDSDECRVVRSLDLVAAPNFDDLLHIPTPWHNCVLKLEDSPHYFVTISDVIRNALEKGTHTGNWDKKEKCFLLKKLTL